MKLIYRILIHLSLALPIILAAWGILFYMAIIDEVNDEVDDSLEDYSEVLITRALAGEQLPSQSDGSNNSYYLITVTADYAEKQKRIRYSDEMVHIEAKGETEPARVLRTIFKDKDRQYYELTVSTPTIEKQDLQEAILNWMLLLYFSLLLLILLVNTWVYYRSMRPLYVLLKWMDQYTIGKSQSPPDLQTNITEFRKLNEAAIQTHRRNQAIYEQQKQFIGNASHELQTPLAICQNRLEMMAESESLTEDQLTEIAKIQQTLTYIIRLNKSLLFLSKIENGQFQESQEICLNDLISSQLEDYQEIYDYKNIQVEVHQSATLTVNMNETLATALITNLLKNAFIHNKSQGKIDIEIQSDHLTICNTGHPEALDASRIFHRFYQGKHSLQGSGIGLSYAKQLVEMHGGIIGAQNNETKGATFFFTLPYRQEAADIQSTPQTYLNDALHLSADIDRKQPQQDSIEKFHSILIVEDDRDLCNYLICNLQVLFEEVYEAHDGMEALPILTSRRPQIVLSDIKMPRMNGFELCRYIKQKPDLNYMPVILLTSCVDDTSMEEGYKMGAEAYITKPFDMDLLFIQIQNIMHNHNFMKNHYATIDIPIQKQENLNYINEQLMIQFNRIINENISNVNMDVNFIAQQMGMSRASLYNKTKGMMDMGISEYIIKCRLEYARKLLDTTTLSIGEVAEQTGFKHSRNFSTVFKNIVGMSPSDYRKKDSRPSCK